MFDIIYSTAEYAAKFLLLSCLGLFSYRLLLHPLRRYPGPFLAKLTDGYAGIYAYMWKLHLVTYQDLKHYGPVMRAGPNSLIFNTVEAFIDIYRSERITKSEVYKGTQQLKDVYNVFNVRDRDLHRSKRKLIGRAVTDQSMRSFEPTMITQVDTFLRLILDASKDTSRRAVNMSERLKYLGYDIVGFLAFGYPLKLQTEDTNRFIIQANAYGNFRLNAYMQWPLLRNLKVEALSMVFPSSLRVRLFNLIEKMIFTRLAQPRDARRDLYYHLSDELGTDIKGVRLGNLWTEAIFFVPAGGDTTSTALSSLFYYLSRNRRCYQKLAEEVRSTFESGKDIHGGPQLSGCHYLRACIDEALRMSPPVPGTLWRELADDTGQAWVIDGHVVPAGTRVGVNIYALHHNEEYFPDPFSFKPERWLDDEMPDDQAKGRALQDAFAAFSTGSRGCAGKAMAYLEASIVVARTMWYFDFEVTPGEGRDTGSETRSVGNLQGKRDEYQLYDVFISIHDGPNLVFKPRGDFYEELENEGVI